jgi:hypothetical protein
MYWQSFWFRSPARRRIGRGIFYLVAIAKNKADDDIASQPANNARTFEAESSLHSERDRQVSDIILSIGHNSGLSAPDARRWTRILGGYTAPNHASQLICDHCRLRGDRRNDSHPDPAALYGFHQGTKIAIA